MATETETAPLASPPTPATEKVPVPLSAISGFIGNIIALVAMLIAWRATEIAKLSVNETTKNNQRLEKEAIESKTPLIVFHSFEAAIPIKVTETADGLKGTLQLKELGKVINLGKVPVQQVSVVWYIDQWHFSKGPPLPTFKTKEGWTYINEPSEDTEELSPINLLPNQTASITRLPKDVPTGDINDSNQIKGYVWINYRDMDTNKHSTIQEFTIKLTPGKERMAYMRIEPPLGIGNFLRPSPGPWAQ